jgi:hypothetical protein
MFYATYDRYGSQTSYGFDNSKVVVAFRTKDLRDKYVKDHGPNNLGSMRSRARRRSRLARKSY